MEKRRLFENRVVGQLLALLQRILCGIRREHQHGACFWIEPALLKRLFCGKCLRRGAVHGSDGKVGFELWEKGNRGDDKQKPDGTDDERKGRRWLKIRKAQERFGPTFQQSGEKCDRKEKIEQQGGGGEDAKLDIGGDAREGDQQKNRSGSDDA